MSRYFYWEPSIDDHTERCQAFVCFALFLPKFGTLLYTLSLSSLFFLLCAAFWWHSYILKQQFSLSFSKLRAQKRPQLWGGISLYKPLHGVAPTPPPPVPGCSGAKERKTSSVFSGYNILVSRVQVNFLVSGRSSGETRR